VWEIDEHMGATASGILSDARILVERAQLRAQQHKVTYDSPIDVLSVVKDICNLKQLCTQSGGLRPFGVALLIAGVDEAGIKLFETDPTGIYFQYKASVIGEGEAVIEEILHKEYKENMSVEDGFKLGLRALQKFLGKDFNIERVDGACVMADEKKYIKLTRQKIESLLENKTGKKK